MPIRNVVQKHIFGMLDVQDRNDLGMGGIEQVLVSIYTQPRNNFSNLYLTVRDCIPFVCVCGGVLLNI